MSDMSYIEYQESQGEHASKFIVGDETLDGHTHIFFLRDDLPRATTSSSAYNNDFGWHAHSIFATDVTNPKNTLVCEANGPNNHTHTKFTEVENV